MRQGAAASDGANKEHDDQLLCLTKSEVAAKLTAENRPKKRLTRVTVPSTASTEFRTRMPIVTGSDDQFARFASLDCHKLCFHNTTTKDDPFIQLEFISMNDGHHAYDKVLQISGENDPYLMTTLRDPVDYCMANYKRRAFWDGKFDGIKDLHFEEWLQQVPWRANQMTRMMGRSHGDLRVLTGIMDPIVTEELQADVYMKEQNTLGEKSQVLQKAWERLQQMQWFGLFHRLSESMELLAFTFCADTEKLLQYYTRPSPPTSHLDKLQSRVVGEISDEEKERLVTEILKRNQLDVILLERAEALLDERLEEMHKAKENGVLCRFAGTVDVTCDKSGDDDRNDAREEL